MNMHARTSPLWETDEFICFVVDHDDAKLPFKTEDGRTEAESIGSALVVVVRGKRSERIYRSHAVWPRSAVIEKAMSQAELWRAEFADRLDDPRPIWQRKIAVEPRTCAQCSAAMHPVTSLGPDDIQEDRYECPNGHPVVVVRRDVGLRRPSSGDRG